MKDLKALADTLVAACRDGREDDLLSTIYADDAASVEAVEMGQGRDSVGLDAIRGKHAWWNSAMDVSGSSVSDPMLHGDDRFAVIFEVQGREKATGNTFDMKEVGVYTVADGKIVREEFFYAPNRQG